MDLDALLTLLLVVVVVSQVLRAIWWLIGLPPGAIVDAMLASGTDPDDDDLSSRTPAQRNRYRALRR